MSFVKQRGKPLQWVPKPILDAALAKKAAQDKQAAEQAKDKNEK